MTAATEKPRTTNTAEPTPWQRLREPFSPDHIGKLPRATVNRDEYKTLTKGRCSECGGWHPTTKTIHLDFVGHADTTDRLLAVDPGYKLEPLSREVDAALLADAVRTGDPEIVRMVLDNAPPQFVRNGAGDPIGYWVRLTVCGESKLGYGSCEPGKADAVKELIGDAMRNAAMRFGVALDLWRKERPVEHDDDTNTASSRNGAAGTSTGSRPPAAPPSSGQKSPARTVVTREPVIRNDRRAACPECGDGLLELVVWGDGRRTIACTNWRNCRYREQVTADTKVADPEPVAEEPPDFDFENVKGDYAAEPAS